MRIRRATSDDVAFILKGRAENARISFRHALPARAKKQLSQKIRRALLSKKEKIFVAAEGGTRFGFAWLSVKKYILPAAKIGLIRSLWVVNQARRIGVATALIKEAAGYFKVQKCTKMRATYTATNLSMEVFCKKNGFKISRIQVEKHP